MTKAMTEVKLKPYPFCGSEDFVLGFHNAYCVFNPYSSVYFNAYLDEGKH